MKQCVPRKTDRMLALLFAAILAGMSALPFYELIGGDQSPLACLALGLFWAGTALYLLVRMLRMGGWGFYYDEERVIFALSRSDRREYRWDALAAAGVRFVFAVSFDYFIFPDGKRLNLMPRMDGYEEFMEVVRRKNVPAAQGINVGDLSDEPTAKKVFEEMFGEAFGKGGKKR